MEVWEIVVLLSAVGIVAFLYSSVGHGGATGYLAIGTFLSIAPEVSRPGALLLNCVVAGIGFWRFQRAGFFDGKLFLSLASFSMPAAWWCSRLDLTGKAHSLVLGITLFVAAWLLDRGNREVDSGTMRPVWGWSALAGGVLGGLAGLTGIGGGVFLTPLLIFLRWAPAKTAGGVSALFIFVNSVAGLLGNRGSISDWPTYALVAPALGAVGALVGTYLGVRRWTPDVFRKVLAFVLLIASFKLVFVETLWS